MGGIGYEVSTADMSKVELSVGLWIPSVRADTVATELGGLDFDMRRAAAWQPWASPDFRRRLPPPLRFYLEEIWEGMGYLGWPWPLTGPPVLEPIDASEGGLAVLGARQGDSLDIDFQAIGLVLGMLVDIPAAFLVVRALFRRSEAAVATGAPPQIVELGRVQADLGGHRLLRDGDVLPIKPKAFELLAFLIRNPGQVFTRDQLLEKVWGYDYAGETRTVDVHVHWLRSQIEEDPGQPAFIHTVRGVGYVFRRPV